MDLMESIKDYWSVQPPYKGEGEVGTREWSDSILRHRYEVIPYCKDLLCLDTVRNRKVFEIGCGSGSDALELCRAGAFVTSVDITQTAVDLTRKRLELEGHKANINTYSGRDLSQYPSNSYDVVHSGGVVHHTPYTDDLLAEAHRILKPGGVLRFMVYNKDSFLYWYSIVYLRQIQQHGGKISRDEALSRYSEFRTGCPYTRAFTADEMKDKLSYFSSVTTSTAYDVYDTLEDRKVKTPAQSLQFRKAWKSGVADVDNFIAKYYRMFESYNEKKHGWHLITEAVK